MQFSEHLKNEKFMWRKMFDSIEGRRLFKKLSIERASKPVPEENDSTKTEHNNPENEAEPDGPKKKHATIEEENRKVGQSVFVFILRLRFLAVLFSGLSGDELQC